MEPGGINTYLWNLKTAWDKLGHTVDLLHAREKGYLRNIHPTEIRLAGRDLRLPGGQFLYGTNGEARQARKRLNGYDLVVFGHQCPHPNIRGEGSRAWQELYDLKVPIFTIFHDNIWEKAYPWLREVADHIDVCLYTNPSIMAGSARSFPGYFVYSPQLLDTTKAGLWREKKADRVIWLPQWKAWKGIGIFVRALPEIRYAVDLFNSGIEYHYLRKEKAWKEWIGRDTWTKKPIRLHGRRDHVVRGTIFPSEVSRRLRRANVSVDLTGYKPGPFSHQTTYVHFESMVYGAVVVLSESVLESPSPIPPDCAISVPTLPTSHRLAKVVNRIMADESEQRRVAKRALSFVTDRFDDRKVAASILDLIGTSPTRGTVKKATKGKLE